MSSTVDTLGGESVEGGMATENSTFRESSTTNGHGEGFDLFYNGQHTNLVSNTKVKYLSAYRVAT